MEKKGKKFRPAKKKLENVDVLAFGAHSDDIELGCGGLLVKMRNSGLSVGIIDLTRGEMNSKATPEVIASEAKQSAKILGANFREILDLGDSRIEDTQKNRILIAELIRKYRPSLVLAPYYNDRHNDHRTTGLLVRNSNLLCRLKKLDSAFPPHGPKLFLFYLLQDHAPPTIVIDITKYYSEKMQAIRAYRSQFEKKASEIGVVPIGIRDYLFHTESRNRFYGSLINARYGEAFLTEGPLDVRVLSILI
ncbi:bacillithiol biosynthesis deacetylase BshB1 [Patescibacteria group bacterium]|nr:bacillithiol biosynthesis deacetylase BshB1 [Patescibacteria group bacterium]